MSLTIDETGGESWRDGDGLYGHFIPGRQLMKNNSNRRGFMKAAGAGALGLALATKHESATQAKDEPLTAATPAAQGEYVGGLTAPKLETVRIGFIGVGARGGSHVEQILGLEGTEITAICDNHEPAALQWQQACEDAGQPNVKVYSNGDYDYRNMLEQENIDIVLISTPWRWHAIQAVDTMLSGKHAFVEVPIATTIDDCWLLVDTAERTQKHCMMMENVCYGRDELMALNMCRLGIFGDLTHGEAAYIHDLRSQMLHIDRGTGSWRTNHHVYRNGNLYPTHGLGPIAQYMNVNRGDDAFSRLVSLSSPAVGRQEFATNLFPANHIRNRVDYYCGDINTSIIKTVEGRTILVQHDTTTPRPYSRLNLIQGTRGALAGFPTRIYQEGMSQGHYWAEGYDLDRFYAQFDHPLWKRLEAQARQAGGHGGMDFVMLWRMIYCLRNGEPLDQNVYEGCSWSVVSPLSEESVRRDGAPVAFPDFTRGKWRQTAPLGIVS